MDFNEYTLECYVRDRLARARADARAAATRRALLPAGRAVVSAAGSARALIALGQWLARAAPSPHETRA